MTKATTTTAKETTKAKKGRARRRRGRRPGRRRASRHSRHCSPIDRSQRRRGGSSCRWSRSSRHQRRFLRLPFSARAEGAERPSARLERRRRSKPFIFIFSMFLKREHARAQGREDLGLHAVRDRGLRRRGQRRGELSCRRRRSCLCLCCLRCCRRRCRRRSFRCSYSSRSRLGLPLRLVGGPKVRSRGGRELVSPAALLEPLGEEALEPFFCVFIFEEKRESKREKKNDQRLKKKKMEEDLQSLFPLFFLSLSR